MTTDPCYTKDEMFAILERDYLKLFLAFSISRISDYHEAEEMAQEIAYRCVEAISAEKIHGDFHAYVWSVAHNTYKNHLRNRERDRVRVTGDDVLTNLKSREAPPVERMIRREEAEGVRLALSRLWGMYRKTMVDFYYHGLTVRAIAEKHGTTEEMVKFYLRSGKEKMKEAVTMTIGMKSISPSDFTVYKSSIDFSKVNVWEVFKRKLPCQIALICCDAPKTVSEISMETGTPAVYLEDEIGLLMDAGVMIPVGKNKYRTNFHILKKDAAEKVRELFKTIYEPYVPAVKEAFRKYLPELKESGIFKHTVDENRLAWVFAQHIPDWGEPLWLNEKDYPEILSCGSKAFVFAEEAKGSPWAAGHTPTDLADCTVWACDVSILGGYHCQEELHPRHPEKAQALWDVYCGKTREEDAEIYAQLIEEGYAVKEAEGTLSCNVAVMTKESREVFQKVHDELHPILVPLCRTVPDRMVELVKRTIPEQLADYAYGFAATWLGFYAGVYLMEALHDSGLIAVPEENIPVACRIEVK